MKQNSLGYKTLNWNVSPAEALLQLAAKKQMKSIVFKDS